MLHTLRRNGTPPPLRHLMRFLRLIIRNQQLTLLAVTVRFLASDAHDVEGALEAVDLVEDLVHFFEGAVGCFWEL